MKKILFTIATVLLIILHQDFWNWKAAEPFAFGFLPIGLFYHVCFTLAVSVLMWLMVKYLWPSHLEEELEAPKPAEEQSR